MADVSSTVVMRLGQPASGSSGAHSQAHVERAFRDTRKFGYSPASLTPANGDAMDTTPPATPIAPPHLWRSSLLGEQRIADLGAEPTQRDRR
jgi:hypothetical protein